MKKIPLGKKTKYITTYSPDLLYPIPRKKELPFYGYDIWNAYDLSWLNDKGKPEVGVGEIIISADSENLIESKSLKLYLNSFNGTKFASIDDVAKVIRKDLSGNVKSEVQVKIKDICHSRACGNPGFSGINLDEYDITCTEYQINPNLLFVEDSEVTETLYSHILKSNCPVTSQPDFGSVEISYKGKKINHQGLLKYIVSFRDHNEFHEACIERIFVDIMRKCTPQELTVYGRYNRRGGMDINPFRTTDKNLQVNNNRLFRQ
jgi:7-cyano-7-deazaguanine reductase